MKAYICVRMNYFGADVRGEDENTVSIHKITIR
jgi:hypothetical protein